MSSDETTKVIFRKWPKKEGGDIIAIFPEDIGNMSPYTCMMYEHVGQHGGGDPQLVIRNTAPAKPPEYANLKEELEGMGYSLQVIQKNQYTFLETRKKLLKEMDEVLYKEMERVCNGNEQKTT